VCLFFKPFNATRITASGINERIRQLQTEKEHTKDNASATSKGGFWDEFEVSGHVV
jgi:hypothetical protein